MTHQTGTSHAATTDEQEQSSACAKADNLSNCPSELGCGEPTLLRAELFTLTGDDDNKDHDTGIYITVKSGDEKILIASVNNADSSGKDMTEYNDDSHHIVPLVVEAPGATRSICEGFKVRMWIKTNGSDKWTIDDARITLYFSDGTTLVADKYNFALEDDGDSTDFNSP